MKSLVSSSSFSFHLLKRSVWEHVPWSTLLDAHFNHSKKIGNHFTQEHALRNFSISNNNSNVVAKNVNQSLPTVLVSSCLLGEPVSYRGTCARCVKYKYNNIGKRYSHDKFNDKVNYHKSSSNTDVNKGMIKYSYLATPFTFFIDVICDYLCELNYIRCIPFCPEVQLLHLPCPRPPIKLVCKSNCYSCPYSCNSFERKNSYCTSLVQTQTDKDENNPMKALLSWQHTQPHQLYCHDTYQDRLYNCESETGQEVDITKVTTKRKTLSTFCVHTMHSNIDAQWSCLLPVPLCEIDGIVCKARSPSCGVGDARLYRLDDQTSHTLYTANVKSKTQIPYTQCDGFFVQWLRHMYEINHIVKNDLTTSPFTSSLTASPPIISELLMNGNDVSTNKETSCKTCNNRNCSDNKSLLSFMDNVLKHYEHRTSEQN